MPHAGHERRSRTVEVSISAECSAIPVDEQRLRQAVTSIVDESEFDSAAVSVAVVDDATLHDLNRRFLNHDYPTDVLSFVLENADGHLEGEVIVSADMAAAIALEVGWPNEAELLLYVIHGTLHLVGYEDQSPSQAAKMRTAEARCLARFGYTRRAEFASDEAVATDGSVSREVRSAT
jgi:probable rRNA maturation factor